MLDADEVGSIEIGEWIEKSIKLKSRKLSKIRKLSKSQKSKNKKSAKSKKLS